MLNRPAFLTFTAALLAAPAFAAVDFEKDVKPILEFNCVRCHNPKGTDYIDGKTDLDLTTNEGATADKSTIVPGNAEKSRLYTTTVLPDDAKKVMPPKNKATGAVERLAKADSEMLKTWINEGAKWPDGAPLIGRKKEVASNAAKETETVANIAAKIATTSTEKEPGDMKAYKTTIPGTDVDYDMLPIPGGKFKMGSPDSEAGRQPDEGPVHEVEIAPFWMQKCETTWNAFELFMYPNEEKKTREPKKLDPALNALTDAVTRPTQPYVEMSFGMGKDGFPAISMTHHSASKY